MLSIATFNINGVTKRLANLMEWLERESAPTWIRIDVPRAKR